MSRSEVLLRRVMHSMGALLLVGLSWGCQQPTADSTTEHSTTEHSPTRESAASQPLNPVEQLAQQILKHPTWMLNQKQCVADIQPMQMQVFDYTGFPEQIKACQANPQQCYTQCEQQDALACYTLAHVLSNDYQLNDAANALYQYSCGQGVASGCTNRAAALLSPDGETSPQNLDCAVRTFQGSCEAQDPWGCVMYAVQLATGSGVPRDIPKALNVLEGACYYGEQDAACIEARQIRGYLEQIN